MAKGDYDLLAVGWVSGRFGTGHSGQHLEPVERGAEERIAAFV